MRARTWLASAIVFAGLSSASLFAEPKLTARVNTNEVALSGSITLVLEISGVGDAGSAPNLTFPDFQIQRAGQTVSYQWVNGQSSSLVNYNYILTPTKIGTLKIPAVSMSVNGKNYSTDPIMIEVRPETAGAPGGSAAPSSSSGSHAVQVPSEGLKTIFMTASVDASKVYVGQQILLKVQFLRRPDVRLSSQARYSEPDVTGFLVEPLQQQEYTSTINGAQYQVTELPYALFPTSDGEFAIGSAHIDLAVRAEADPFDPNSFFQNFFGRSQLVKLDTRAIPVHVRALPSNKPANFSGAVGRFKITAKVDQAELEVGKAFNLIVTVEGVGNIKTIKEPALPELKGFRRYETLSSSKISKEGKFVHGSKEFKILMIPQVSGNVTIPPIQFVYFSPEQADYVTETTPDIALKIKSGTLAQRDQETTAEPAPAQATAEGVRVMEKDIRFLKNGSIRPIQPPLYQRTAFILLNLLPPLFAFVAFLTRRQSEQRVKRAAEFRVRGALRSAHRRLKEARRELKQTDPTPFYGVVHSALAGYLADKLGLSASGLLWNDVERRLAEKGVGDDLRSRLRSLFEEADMARFATSSFTDEAREISLQSTQTVMTDLEKTL